jgi:hypothetical protein
MNCDIQTPVRGHLPAKVGASRCCKYRSSKAVSGDLPKRHDLHNVVGWRDAMLFPLRRGPGQRIPPPQRGNAGNGLPEPLPRLSSVVCVRENATAL